MIYRYFLPCCGCLFTFLIIPFRVQIFNSQKKPILCTFTFIISVFEAISKKPSINTKSWRFTLKSLIVLALPFRSDSLWVHFYIECEEGVQLHCFAGGLPVVLEPFIGKTILELSWHPCQKSVDEKHRDLHLDSQFYSTDTCVSLGLHHIILITVPL